jgi:hypothetical protein
MRIDMTLAKIGRSIKNRENTLVVSKQTAGWLGSTGEQFGLGPNKLYYSQGEENSTECENALFGTSKGKNVWVQLQGIIRKHRREVVLLDGAG